MKRSAHARRCAGFTLVELLIGGLLFASMLLTAGLATDRCFGMFRQRSAEDELTTNANRLLQRIAGEFSFARAGSLAPMPDLPLGASTLTYQECLGAPGGVLAWGPPRSLGWELEPGEFDDGQDNNGNGLIDEGQAVWIENPGAGDEQRVVWAHGLCEFLPGETFDGADEDGDGLIDERGLMFSIAGDVLTIRVGLQGLGPDRRRITRGFETSVLLRN